MFVIQNDIELIFFFKLAWVCCVDVSFGEPEVIPHAPMGGCVFAVMDNS